MKFRKNLFLNLAAAMALGCTSSLHAAALTWTGGPGTWQVGNAGQWGANWVDGDTATFNGPGGAVTLGGAVTTGNAALTFTAGNYTISAAAPLAIALGNTNINLGAVTTTIGTNVTVNRDTWIIDGATTATSALSLSGGTLSAVGGNTTIREATVNVGTGSVLRSPGSMICGLGTDGAALTVSGGTVTIDGTGTSLILNNGGVTASVTMTISSGAISFLSGGNTAGIRYGGNAAGNTTGVFNLDGGVVTVNKVFEQTVGTINSTFNFNGGTLRARRENTADFMTGLDAAVVKGGGAVIDTNGFNLKLNQPLTAGSPSGGLTKNGLGTLTLSGISNYSGATSVTTGRLNVAAGGSLVSAVTVASGATLGGEGTVTATPGFAAAGSNFAFDPATPGSFTAPMFNLGTSVIQLSSDSAMTNGTTYLVMTSSDGFPVSPATNFRGPSRGTLAFAGNNLNFTPAAPASLKWKGSDVTNPTYWDSEITSNWDNGGATDKFFPIDDVLFDETASSFTVAIPGSPVRPASVTFNNTTTYSLSGGAIDGTTGITKNGSGIVTLGNANTYTGTTAINAGTLQLSGGSAISNIGLITLADVAGTNLLVLGSETIGAISGGGATGGNVSIDAAQTLTLASGTQTHTGTISGGGALAVAGAVQTLDGVVSNSSGLSVSGGRVTLAGNNNYTGPTSIGPNSGIILSNANSLGATGPGNETTILGSGGTASGQIGLSGGITFTAEKVVGSGAGHVTPATVDGFAVQQRGMIQSVSGNNTFAGNVEINSSGITRFGTQDSAQLTISGSITRSIGVTGIQVLFRAGNTSGDFITLSSAANDFDECIIFSATPSGNAGLRLGVDNALPVLAPLLGGNSASSATSLDLNGFDQTVNGLRFETNSEGPFKIVNLAIGDNPSTLTLANKQNSFTSVGAISNNGGSGGVIHVVKTGGFVQGLGATNTYTGTTAIQGGRLSFLKQVALYNNTPASWTPANITVESTAILGLAVGGTGEFTATDVETLITNLSVSNGNGLKAGSALFLNATVDTTITTPLANSTGTTGGAIGLDKTGTAKLTLAGANSYSGNTTVTGGTLQLNSPNNTNEGSTVTIATTGAFLELNFDETGGPVTDTVDKLFLGGVQQNAGIYKSTANVTDSGTGIAQITGGGTLTVLTGPAGFAAWQLTNGTTGALDEDHDNDGVDNGTEYFLYGSANSTGFTELPGVANNLGTLSVTWTKAATGYTGTYGAGFVVETSDTLAADSWVTATEGAGPDKVVVTGNDVKYTFPTGSKKFARLKVTGP